jgi:hypothetical protein
MAIAERERSDRHWPIPEPPQATPAAGAPPVELLLRLQRGAGNQAVARMLLQRQEAATAAEADPNPFENEVDEEEAPEEEAVEEELGPEDMLEAPAVDEGETPEGGARTAEETAEPAPPPAGNVLARAVMLQDAAASGGWRAMTRAQREAFVRRRFRGRRRRLAYRILADMAATSNPLNYDTEDELYDEVLKRVTSSVLMQESQDGARRTTRDGVEYTVRAFGYPFSGGALFYGPRVNYAAKDYWTPGPPDAYARRSDRTQQRRVRGLPRRRRHEVFGDQPPGYRFTLTPAGHADFFSAVTKLFIPQSPHKQSLIHCDYLLSLVQLRSFAATLGKPEFNRRAAAYPAASLTLTALLFSQLEFSPSSGGTPGPLASLQRVQPASEADFVIGDHVYFFNHQAYDLINERKGNAWRLENTILIDRRGGTDLFLGHGSGRKTAAQLRAKLATEYNDVADMAIQLTRRADRGEQAAQDALRDEFPRVVKDAGRWRVRGTAWRVPVDIELRRIRGDEVVGPYNPSDPTQLYHVRRPIESV